MRLINIFSFLIIGSLYGCSSNSGNIIEPSYTKIETHNISDKTHSGKDTLAYELALQLIKIKKYHEAENLLSKLNKKYEPSASALANLALVHYKLNKIDSAEKYIQHAITIKHDQFEYENIAGLIAIEKGDFKKAEQYYRSALSINQEYANSHYNLALLYDIYYQDIDVAYKHYTRYLELIDYTDTETTEWVEQLKYSLKQD